MECADEPEIIIAFKSITGTDVLVKDVTVEACMEPEGNYTIIMCLQILKLIMTCTLYTMYVFANWRFAAVLFTYPM